MSEIPPTTKEQSKARKDRLSKALRRNIMARKEQQKARQAVDTNLENPDNINSTKNDTVNH